MATKRKDKWEIKFNPPIRNNSAEDDYISPEKNQEDTQTESEIDLEALSCELAYAKSKILELEKLIIKLVKICGNLGEQLEDLNDKSDRLEEMTERSFVIFKVLEGNQQRLIKIGLEGLARRDLRLEKKTFTLQEMAAGFHTSRMSVDRWRKGSKKNPDKRIRYKYDYDTGKPYFLYKELLEDILNDRVPTNKSKDFLLECLEVMIGKSNSSDRKSELEEEIPEEFKDYEY